MARPQALLLDVMSTLVYEPFLEAVPAFFGMSLSEIIEQKHPTAWIEFERGACDEDSLFERFFADGRSFDHAGLKQTMVAAYRWLDGMEPLLGELRDEGVPMYALSNYPVWYELIEDKLGVSRYVDWRFVSCLTGVRKPDPRAYLDAAAALEMAPSELLFVDDRRRNCEGARAVSMQAAQFRDAPTLRAELAARGLVPGP